MLAPQILPPDNNKALGVFSYDLVDRHAAHRYLPLLPHNQSIELAISWQSISLAHLFHLTLSSSNNHLSSQYFLKNIDHSAHRSNKAHLHNSRPPFFS